MNLRQPVNKQPDQRPTRPSLKSQSGAGLVEYALLIALLVVMAIPAVGFMGEGVDSIFEVAGQEIATAGGTVPGCEPPQIC